MVVRMLNYRLYCLGHDGHIGLADWIEADTDDEAIAKARQLRPDAELSEVWLQNRLVARVNSLVPRTSESVNDLTLPV